VLSPAPEARYEVWLTSSLDLTDPGQPVARFPVDRADGRFAFDWEPGDLPWWLFVVQSFQPRGNPPLDLYVPYDLEPFLGRPEHEIRVRSVDPRLLLERRRFSTAPAVLARWIALCALVLGTGLLLRRKLRPWEAAEGARSAPLHEVPEPPPPGRRERLLVRAALAAALALRLCNFRAVSLDLLEVSYLPGIGRPAPFAEGAVGLRAVPRMLQELSQLYCLDLVHPPLYHAIMGVIGLLGRDEWLLRTPALAASLATLLLLWRLLRRFSVAAAVAAAWVFALAAPAVYFGQDATPYALVGLCTIASIPLLFRALRTGHDGHWWAYFGLLVGGFLCHYNVAQLGGAELLLLGMLAWRNRKDRRWGAAWFRAMRPALLLSPLPLGWAWLHFSTFPTVAQDTRLVADSYARDPGLLSFSWDFFTATGGIPAAGPVGPGLALAALLVLGLVATTRAGREPAGGSPGSASAAPFELGFVLLGVTLGFLLSILFFYRSLVTSLDDKVYYGFRWVGWFHPAMLGLVVLGALRGPGPRWLRGALAALWLVFPGGLVPATLDQVLHPPKPDYAGVARHILKNLDDRDALATLPTWFQRGNLSHYLMDMATVRRLPEEGEGTWVLRGRRLIVEAVHPSLPFQTTARNAHFERLWVASVDERSFGRAKFREAVSRRALEWADEHMRPDGEWRFNRVVLRRYRRRAGDLLPAPAPPVVLSSAATVMHYRMYPPPDDPKPDFVPPAELPPHPGALGPTVLYQAPMTPGCVDWGWAGLAPELGPEAPHHWYLELRVPAMQDGRQPQLVKLSPAMVHARADGALTRATAVGTPCDGAPLLMEIRVPP
jgi:hypothetical protein